jgi:ribulose 1,5-bisphosphate synthetase/thiazole synthase
LGLAWYRWKVHAVFILNIIEVLIMVYDLIVIGGGPGGSTAAKTAAEGGTNVLLLEAAEEGRYK